jgi:hypothetical protein
MRPDPVVFKGAEALAVAIAAGYEALQLHGVDGLSEISIERAEALLDLDASSLRLTVDPRSDHRAIPNLPEAARDYAGLVYDFLPLADMRPLDPADPEDLEAFGMTSDTDWLLAVAAALHDRRLDNAISREARRSPFGWGQTPAPHRIHPTRGVKGARQKSAP